MAQPCNHSHHAHELQLAMCIIEWQEHINVLEKDVLALKDLLSSLSKIKDDATIELQRILDQVKDRKRLLARVDGELLQL